MVIAYLLSLGLLWRVFQKLRIVIDVSDVPAYANKELLAEFAAEQEERNIGQIINREGADFRGW